jgi:hypothetical protein
MEQYGPVSVDHYENFPVASWLCPKHLRGAVEAIYRVAGDATGARASSRPVRVVSDASSLGASRASACLAA